MGRIVFAFFSIIIISIWYFLLNSVSFEHIKPIIQLSVIKDSNNMQPFHTASFFNPDNDIELRAFDSSGLFAYSIKVTKSNGEVIISKNEILLKHSKNIEVILPKLQNLKNGDEIFYTVSVRDWSNANFFKGNKTTLTKHLVVNNIPPKINIIATSEQIAYGGSALIAFQIHNAFVYQDNQEIGVNKIIVSNGQDKFEAYPYINKHKELIYLALIAWPTTNNIFEGKIQVIDTAMNDQVINIPIALNINRARRSYNVNISDEYARRLIQKLEESIVIPQNLIDDIEKFQFFNESIRQQENQRIAYLSQFTTYNASYESIPRLNVFTPIASYKTFGRFGDKYTFKYAKENIGSSIRIGVDLVGTQSNNVISSNIANVIYTGRLGAYGNLIILNHVFGLSTVYGYLQDIPNIVKEIQPLDKIGQSGQSGFATTNSVFFATLVQGYFVEPKEWLDAKWVDVNINQVLEKADNYQPKQKNKKI